MMERTGSSPLGTPGTATCPDGFALVVSEDVCRTLGVITSSGAARYTGTGEAAGGKLSFAGDYMEAVGCLVDACSFNEEWSCAGPAFFSSTNSSSTPPTTRACMHEL